MPLSDNPLRPPVPELALVHPALLHDLPDPPIVLPPILVVQPARFRIRRTGRVRIAQQALDARQDRRDVVDGTPLVLQYVQTDLPVVVDVGVEHLRQEADRGGLVGVVFGELQDELEGPALPGGVVGAEDDGLPEHDVGVHGGAGDAGGGVVLEAAEVAEEAAAGGGAHGRRFRGR
ncbi:hypothetical protein ACHAWF_004648 [Thalassiosira exigua]